MAALTVMGARVIPTAVAETAATGKGLMEVGTAAGPAMV